MDLLMATLAHRQKPLPLTKHFPTALTVVYLGGVLHLAHLAAQIGHEMLHAHLLVFLQELPHLRAALLDALPGGRFLHQLLAGGSRV